MKTLLSGFITVSIVLFLSCQTQSSNTEDSNGDASVDSLDVLVEDSLVVSNEGNTVKVQGWEVDFLAGTIDLPVQLYDSNGKIQTAVRFTGYLHNDGARSWTIHISDCMSNPADVNIGGVKVRNDKEENIAGGYLLRYISIFDPTDFDKILKVLANGNFKIEGKDRITGEKFSNIFKDEFAGADEAWEMLRNNKR